MYGERKVAHRISVRKPEGNRPLGRSRRRLVDNIKMNLQEMGWGHGPDWSGSGYGQVGSLVKEVRNFQVP
jgi:hypothetical protein